MKKYVELGYPVTPGYPPLPVGCPNVTLTEDLAAGAPWNGSVLNIHLHGGTHMDAPWHYIGGDSAKMDNMEAIPTSHFVYDHPIVINITPTGENYLITPEDVQAYGEEIYEADAIIFNTGNYKKYRENFMGYAIGAPSVGPKAALWIRENLPKVKMVGIDAAGIENLSEGFGASDGYQTHKAFLDPAKPNSIILIIEYVNTEPLIGKKLLRAFTAPVRTPADASIVNIIAEVED